MNTRQARFVQEYLIDRNGAAAAIRAGYSRHTARQIAHEILTRPDVAAAVSQGEAKLAEKAELSRAAALKGFQEAIEIARLLRAGAQTGPP
jgi:phage terminase small subunit